MENILNSIFTNLNSNNINYCVLRAYEIFPVVENDIDFAIAEQDLERGIQVFSKVLAHFNYTLAKRTNKFGLIQLYFINIPGKASLHIDLKYKFAYRGLEYLDVDRLLAEKIPYKNIFIPSPEFKSATIFLKEILHNNYLRRKKYPDLKAGVNERFDKVMGDYFSEADVAKYHSFIMGEETKIANPGFKYFNLFKNNILKTGPVATLSNWFSYINKELQLFFKPSGLMIVLMGPDGSGKTTTFNLIKDEIAGHYFSGIKYFHFRYEVIPSLAKLAGKKVDETTPLITDDTPRMQKKKGRLYWIYPYYYYFDYLLGGLKLRYYKYKNQLVVFDRYYLDYVINDNYYSLPGFLTKIYQWTITKPDVLLYLKADAQKIFDRKPELTVEEITNQQKNITEKILNNPNFFKRSFALQTDNTPDENIEVLLNVLNPNHEI